MPVPFEGLPMLLYDDSDDQSMQTEKARDHNPVEAYHNTIEIESELVGARGLSVVEDRLNTVSHLSMPSSLNSSKLDLNSLE